MPGQRQAPEIRLGDVAGGDGVKFEEVFEALFTRAYHVAYRILAHSGEAEDAAAEALARALRSWKKVRSLNSPEAWVVRVTTNLAIDVLRRRKWVAEDHEAASTEPTAHDRLDESDTRMALRELLRTLPRRQRDVLALRYLADLSEADTATVLGIAPGSVKRHASRGIDRIRRRFAELDADGAAGPDKGEKEVVRVAW